MIRGDIRISHQSLNQASKQASKRSNKQAHKRSNQQTKGGIARAEQQQCRGAGGGLDQNQTRETNKQQRIALFCLFCGTEQRAAAREGMRINLIDLIRSDPASKQTNSNHME
jgi:DNA-directed RNA polymerase subunit M/transcription elongation factor TFIIS